MKVALLASMRIEGEFDQGSSMNGNNFKIIFMCCGKNVFKDPDDNNSEDLVSSLSTLEDTMLSLPMACHYHRLKLVVIFGMQTGNSAKFIRKSFIKRRRN